MALPLIRLYIAQSLDGYIATADGGIDWLAPFDAEDYGYAAFAAGLAAIVMGRATYEQARGFAEWPYPGKRVIVLTSAPLEDAPDGVEGVADPDEIVDLLHDIDGTVWLCGGAETVRAFLDRGAVDRIELYVIPVLLGDGIALFQPSNRADKLTLLDARTFGNGVVRLEYAVG
jgi:dihydrofolate reductase